MNTVTRNLLFVAILAALAGCGSTDSKREPGGRAGPVNTGPEVDIEEIRAVLNCRRDEVAICIETDCDAEDYACAKRDDMRYLLNPVIRQ